ncbi:MULTISPECIES: response regulator transcription factor [unclassified Coleofasciculus]|uniref:response regulator transcription factor n=1 Tax=unclassified Coleofasciculus TaxID=2692782 RepID=UPI00187E96BA|nr:MULTISPECIES: response regulator [unclassified Coleofasciculus]MBE9127669.1 response regulator [Coleofasciculus sp. LEGE 07081]MBE9151007.1 response regulator [Coleofasciculus sp. LEGE 07092]
MSTVLIVEDDLTQRQLLSMVIKKLGLSVIIAVDGIEALEKVEQYSPELIILDIIMPRMNGYEVCRRLRADVKTENLPVVMCSAKKEEFDRYWGMKQGADAYLSKPCRPQEVVETVQKLLNRDRQAVG